MFLRACATMILLAALAAPTFAAPPDVEFDLDGAPDLRVRVDMLDQWIVRLEDFANNACGALEGTVLPGTRKVLRFTVGIANVGDADLYIGDPQEHIDADDGLYEFAPCHRHFHFRNYAIYELIDPRTGQSWRSAKRGFCIVDTDPNPEAFGRPTRPAIFDDCLRNQGISYGWTDTYGYELDGQYFVLDGADGQPVVEPGEYILRVTANPPYDESPANECLERDPLTGKCHALEESDYSNNVGEIRVRIPADPGRRGSGPLARNAREHRLVD